MNREQIGKLHALAANTDNSVLKACLDVHRAYPDENEWAVDTMIQLAEAYRQMRQLALEQAAHMPPPIRLGTNQS
jgi:hypothetical protein